MNYGLKAFQQSWLKHHHMFKVEKVGAGYPTDTTFIKSSGESTLLFLWNDLPLSYRNDINILDLAGWLPLHFLMNCLKWVKHTAHLPRWVNQVYDGRGRVGRAISASNSFHYRSGGKIKKWKAFTSLCQSLLRSWCQRKVRCPRMTKTMPHLSANRGKRWYLLPPVKLIGTINLNPKHGCSIRPRKFRNQDESRWFSGP